MYKQTKGSILIGALLISLTGYSQADTMRTAGNLPYILFAGNGTKQVKKGSFVKYHTKITIHDSVYFNSFDHIPSYTKVGEPTDYDVSELWPRLKVGDSVVAVQLVDTFFNRPKAIMGPEFKRGDIIIHNIKVLDILPNDSAVVNSRKAEIKKELAREIGYIQSYFIENNITAKKTASGAFVQFIDPGKGSPIIKGKKVTIEYTGWVLGGKAFDSNTDSAFHNLGPSSFVIGKDAMMKGFEEGIFQLKPGTIARIYIPSLLAFGANPQPGRGIKPYDNLVYDIKIISVKDK